MPYMESQHSHMVFIFDKLKAEDDFEITQTEMT